MKKVILVVAVFLLVISGCSRSEPREVLSNQDGRASAEAGHIFQGLELPPHVENVLSGTIAWPLTAQPYETSWTLKGSEEEIRSLMRIDESDLTPILVIASSGLKLTSYDLYVRALTSAFPFRPPIRESPGVQMSGVSKADYPPGNLSFMTQEDACRQVLKTLSELGIENVELEQACALKGETLEEDMQKYASKLRARGYSELEDELQERLDVSFGEDRECYYFSFCMKIGEDRVFTAPATDQEVEISGAMTYCLYGPSGGTVKEPGFIEAEIRYVPTELNGQGEQPVIGPDAAAAAVLPELNNLPAEVKIEEVDFCYCYYNRDRVLHPTWVFVLTSISEVEEEKYIITHYLAVDAITGEMITRGRR